MEGLLSLLPEELRVPMDEFKSLAAEVQGYLLNHNLYKDNNSVIDNLLRYDSASIPAMIKKGENIGITFPGRGLGSLAFHLAVLELRGIAEKSGEGYKRVHAKWGEPKTALQGYLSDVGWLSPLGEPYCNHLRGLGHEALAGDIKPNTKNPQKILEDEGWIKWGRQRKPFWWTKTEEQHATDAQRQYIIDWCAANHIKFPRWLEG